LRLHVHEAGRDTHENQEQHDNLGQRQVEADQRHVDEQAEAHDARHLEHGGTDRAVAYIVDVVGLHPFQGCLQLREIAGLDIQALGHLDAAEEFRDCPVLILAIAGQDTPEGCGARAKRLQRYEHHDADDDRKRRHDRRDEHGDHEIAHQKHRDLHQHQQREGGALDAIDVAGQGMVEV